MAVALQPVVTYAANRIPPPHTHPFCSGLIEGILEKRGKRFKQWKKRYFYVSKRDGALWYFKVRDSLGREGKGGVMTAAS